MSVFNENGDDETNNNTFFSFSVDCWVAKSMKPWHQATWCLVTLSLTLKMHFKGSFSMYWTSHPENVHFELPPKVGQSYMSSELDLGKVHEIRVTGIEEGIKKFVVQIKRSGAFRLELQQKLEKVQLLPLRIFVRGIPCLSLYYRNRTPKICHGLYILLMVDGIFCYGHVELVDLGGLDEIPQELCNIKLQAYRVSLANAHDLYHIQGCTNAFTSDMQVVTVQMSSCGPSSRHHDV